MVANQMSKEKRLSQEPGWVKDYNNAAVSAGRGKQVHMPNEIVKRILGRGPFTKEDMQEAWNAGWSTKAQEIDITFEEWFNKIRGK